VGSYEFESPFLLGLRHHGKGREHQRPGEHESSHLPSQLLLSRPRIDPSHDSDDIDGRGYIEDLEAEVPEVLPVIEEVEIARTEDDGIERLRDEGDTWKTGQQMVVLRRGGGTTHLRRFYCDGWRR